MHKIKYILYVTLCAYVVSVAMSGSIAANSGQLDATFGSSGIVTDLLGMIYTVTLQSDGKIIAAGVSASALTANLLKSTTARYNSDGTFDTSFNATGTQKVLIGSRTETNSVAIQSDDKIVGCGFAYQDQTNFALVRYNADGSLDNSFNGSGWLATSTGTGASLASVAIQDDGAIVVGGTAVNGMPEFVLARYDQTGSLDSSFGSSGIVFTQIGFLSGIKQIAIQSDGKIIAVGYVFDGVMNKFVLARYNTDGSLDSSFGSSGIVTTDIGSESRAHAVVIQGDGSIVVAGYTIQSNRPRFVVVRYDSNGNLDSTFNTTGIVTTDIQNASKAFAVALQSSGKIVVAGFSISDSDIQFALARYTSAGVLDTTFGDNGIVLTSIGSDANINALAIQSDDKIIAAGFSDNNFALARYLA